ncbi:MAG: N-6 DNA methylase [Elusimicrobia bacterium]|nr:N-6 DNA methylase [Elusimicrobiota bacterium]
MSTARFARQKKRQLGQFLTPENIAAGVVDEIRFSPGMRILEPSFGRGVFIRALQERARRIGVSGEVWGCELDRDFFEAGVSALQRKDSPNLRLHLNQTDFFRWMPSGLSEDFLRKEFYFKRDWEFFDLIIGNPPFGGSIGPDIQDALDAVYGWRHGQKIKKETYSFFVVKACDLLRPGGRLLFICSDTFLTINTMRGLRAFLMASGQMRIREVPGLFDETSHPMVLLDFIKTGARPSVVEVFGQTFSHEEIERTGNLSWRLGGEFSKYFTGATLGDFVVATSGMTTGNNDLFLRPIQDGRVVERLVFEFFEEPITLERERARARLNRLSDAQALKISELARSGATRRNVRWHELHPPRVVALPNLDYCYYNKANNKVIYAPAEWAIFWKDAGDAVRTFKKNGNWYLQGVGGKPFFGKSGITWSLVASRVHAKFLPSGYILDSGAPCAFVREGIPEDELYFILGWMLTDLFNGILKGVINHTRNIQGKDVERMPYPVWVRPDEKRLLIESVRRLVRSASAGDVYTRDSPEILQLNQRYIFRSGTPAVALQPKFVSTQTVFL